MARGGIESLAIVAGVVKIKEKAMNCVIIYKEEQKKTID